ncbi:MAG: CoA transferase [Acidobacteriota bacterium]|nr:CoA transferase [Acidobacteriota bacterium]
MRPLSHLTVVALEQAVAAPFATRQLADLGARVIKIERPGAGDFARRYDTTVNGLASHFVWLNRSKQSVTLDLKRPEAADVLARLLARADVFVQNLAPGASARLGLEASALRARYPRLIVGDLSGYGTTGPYRDKKAYDLLIQSEVGLVSITGTPETPSKVGISIADIAAGMYLYSGILTALLVREQTGQGTAVDVSLFEALGEWMSYPAYYASYGGTAPQRTGASHATIAPYGPFAAGDGGRVYLGVQNEREWGRFCAQVLGRPELAADPRFDSNSRRVEHREALHAEIDRVFRTMTAGDIVGRLEAAGIASARMNTVEEFVAHPQLAARDRWRTVGSPAGPIRALRPPVTLDGVEPVMNPVPALGEHTDLILGELGFEAATIAEWRGRGVV